MAALGTENTNISVVVNHTAHKKTFTSATLPSEGVKEKKKVAFWDIILFAFCLELVERIATALVSINHEATASGGLA